MAERNAVREPARVFVVNPGARGGGTRRRLERLLQRAPDIASSSQIVEAGTLDEVAHRLGQCPSALTAVAAGGDGTVNMVAQAIVGATDSGMTLGVVPLGTGNVFAHLTGASSCRRAIDVLRHGVTEAHDIMRTSLAEAPLALLSISAGMEARFIEHYQRRRGDTHILALLTACSRVAGRRSRRVSLTVDDVELVKLGDPIYNVGVYNTPCYAFGKKVIADADPSDGACEVAVCRTARAYWPMVTRGTRASAAQEGSERRVGRWSERAVLTSEGPIQVDGECVSATHCEVTIERGAVKCLRAARRA